MAKAGQDDRKEHFTRALPYLLCKEWLEREIKSRLHVIEGKLDQALALQGPNLAAAPPVPAAPPPPGPDAPARPGPCSGAAPERLAGARFASLQFHPAPLPPVRAAAAPEQGALGPTPAAPVQPLAACEEDLPPGPAAAPACHAAPQAAAAVAAHPWLVVPMKDMTSGAEDMCPRVTFTRAQDLESYPPIQDSEIGAVVTFRTTSTEHQDVIHSAGRRPSPLLLREEVLAGERKDMMPLCTESSVGESFVTTHNQGSVVDSQASQKKDMLYISEWMRTKNIKRHDIIEAIWTFLEEPESSRYAAAYDRFVPAFILLTVAVTLVQLADRPFLSNVLAGVLEVIIESLFTLEVIIRFIVVPIKVAYLTNIFNLIDVASIAPLILRITMGVAIDIHDKDRGSIGVAILLGFVPVTRLLKVLRRFHKFHLLMRAFTLGLEALPVILFIYGAIILIFSTLFYMVEPADNIPDMPTAVWLTIVSMMTVGYGDVVPKSTPGRFVFGLLVFITSLYMAIPLGIIGHAFSEVWDDRDRILLAERTRVKLEQHGFKARDVAKVVRLFDKDGSGLLEFEEFSEMVSEMKLGLTEERIAELFSLADKDSSGEVDPKELMKMLFPYHVASEKEIPLQQGFSMRPATPSRVRMDLNPAVEAGPIRQSLLNELKQELGVEGKPIRRSLLNQMKQAVAARRSGSSESASPARRMGSGESASARRSGSREPASP